jgi:hypothetical protein
MKKFSSFRFTNKMKYWKTIFHSTRQVYKFPGEHIRRFPKAMVKLTNFTHSYIWHHHVHACVFTNGSDMMLNTQLHLKQNEWHTHNFETKIIQYVISAVNAHKSILFQVHHWNDSDVSTTAFGI